MSLPDFSAQSYLFSTAALSGSLFPEKDRYRLFAKLVYPQLVAARSKIEDCYDADQGRPGVEPVLLLGVSLLQYLDSTPDRQAVEMLRYHGGWNFALNRQLGDALFHPTTLVNFRHRLKEHGLGAVGFRVILDALVEAGLVTRQSRQRLDSTQMFARVSFMTRVDCVRECLRLTLDELAVKVPAPARPAWWTGLWDRYVESQVDYRAGGEALARKLVEAGTDAWQVLQWLRCPEQSELAAGSQAQMLGRVFGEQFEMPSQSPTPQPIPMENLETTRLQNPHDPDAIYAVKGRGAHKKEHVGYKVQVAETVSEASLASGEPTRNFLTGIVTHSAHESDETGAALMQAEQAAMGLEKPSVQYVDGAYISAQILIEAQAEGREVIGPAPSAPNNNNGRFTTEHFQVAVEERKAICPAGNPNTQCSRLEEGASGRVTYRFEWSTFCANCPQHQQCVAPKQKHRTIVVGEHHTALQTRRQEQKTDTFKERMKHRNAIEGTQSELVRAHGLRRARYRGLAKVKLQNYFAGAACNIKRWIRQEVWKLQQAATNAAMKTSPQVAS